MGPKGETIYPETPAELAGELADFVREFGANVVGGCCGSTPEHIVALRAAVDAITPPARPAATTVQYAASAVTATALEQEPRPLIGGERINSQGSRKFKRLLLADD